MGDGSRIEREFTYKNRWKRRSIIISPKSPSIPMDGNHTQGDGESADGWSGIHRFNMAGLWRSAGSPPYGVVLIGLCLFPLLVFILSLWLVQAITIQPT
jgi:hypothetical protein